MEIKPTAETLRTASLQYNAEQSSTGVVLSRSSCQHKINDVFGEFDGFALPNSEHELPRERAHRTRNDDSSKIKTEWINDDFMANVEQGFIGIKQDEPGGDPGCIEEPPQNNGDENDLSDGVRVRSQSRMFSESEKTKPVKITRKKRKKKASQGMMASAEDYSTGLSDRPPEHVTRTRKGGRLRKIKTKVQNVTHIETMGMMASAGDYPTGLSDRPPGHVTRTGKKGKGHRKIKEKVHNEAHIETMGERVQTAPTTGESGLVCSERLVRTKPGQKRIYPRYQCDVCGVNLNVASRRSHSQRCYPDSHVTKCDVCGKDIRTMKYKYHKINCKRDKSEWRCELCCFVTFRSQGMSSHRRMHALMGPQHVRRDISYSRKYHSVKRALCEFCGKGFPSLALLNRHQFTHKAERDFRCVECFKTFTQKVSLQAHMRIHTGERPFMCNVCGETFVQCSNLKNHVKVKH